jgi:hypothetical protein
MPPQPLRRPLQNRLCESVALGGLLRRKVAHRLIRRWRNSQPICRLLGLPSRWMVIAAAWVLGFDQGTFENDSKKSLTLARGAWRSMRLLA